MFAQAFGAYSIGQILIVCIVLGACFYIFNSIVELPPKAKMIVNVVLVALLAIVAIRFLLSFV
jgi:uncharacterized protein (DUF983 family)